MNTETTKLDGLAAALNLHATHAQQARLQVVFTDPDNEHFLFVPGAGKPAEVLSFVRNPPPVSMRLADIDSFLSYVYSIFGSGSTAQTEIAISKTDVVANFHPRTHLVHTAQLNLAHAPEFLHMQKLFAPLSQKELWRLCATQLRDVLPASLLLLIQSLQLADNKNAETTIDATGLSKATSAREVQVTFKTPKGPQTQEVQVDWTYSGPVFGFSDTLYTIALRMELSVQDGALAFAFHPIHLEKVLRAARADVVTLLRARLAEAKIDIPIYLTA